MADAAGPVGAAAANPAAAAAALALAEANDALKKMGLGDGVDHGAVGTKERADIEARRLRDKTKIEGDAAADAAARKAGRDAALAGTVAERDLAGFTSLLLRGKAAALAAFGDFGLPKAPDLGRRAIPSGYTPEVAKTVRGAFSFGNAQQVFGGDNQPVISAIKGLTEALRANQKALEAKATEQRKDAKNYTDDTTNVVVRGPAIRFS